MNQDESSVESALRKLRVAPVPDDLFARLVGAEPIAMPARPQRSWQRAAWAGLALAAAACCLLVFRQPGPGPGGEGPSVTRHLPVRQMHHEATLLDQRVLAVIQRDGQMWEIAEEQWVHRAELVQASPAGEISATLLKREFVCRPVVFD
jgi:hypothetical protein